MPEAAQVGLYFLIGESEGEDQRQVYIGQTGSLPERMARHNCALPRQLISVTS